MCIIAVESWQVCWCLWTNLIYDFTAMTYTAKLASSAKSMILCEFPPIWLLMRRFSSFPAVRNNILYLHPTCRKMCIFYVRMFYNICLLHYSDTKHFIVYTHITLQYRPVIFPWFFWNSVREFVIFSKNRLKCCDFFCELCCSLHLLIVSPWCEYQYKLGSDWSRLCLP